MSKLHHFAFGAALICLTWAAPAARADDAQSSAKVVRAFFESWSTGNVDKVMAFIGDDIRYENIPPLGPDAVMTDKAKMKVFLAPFFDPDGLIVPTKFHTEVKRIVADDQGGVAAERVDHQIIAGKDYLNPVAAFFTVKDGKIVSWTDYFDGKTLEPVEVLMTGLAKKK
jgi:limonene-1,2-epoxide hydrolase